MFKTKIELTSGHLHALSFLDDFGVEEQVWVGFPHLWQSHEFGVVSVHNSCGEGTDEGTLVHAHSSPAGGFVEGCEVFSIVQHVEQGLALFTVFLVVRREHSFAFKETSSVHVEEVLVQILK